MNVANDLYPGVQSLGENEVLRLVDVIVILWRNLKKCLEPILELGARFGDVKKSRICYETLCFAWVRSAKRNGGCVETPCFSITYKIRSPLSVNP